MAVSHTSHALAPPHAAESRCSHLDLLSTGWRRTCRTLLLPIDDATWCGGTDHNRCIVAAVLVVVVVVVVRRRRLPIVKVLVGFGLGLFFGSLVIL